MPTRALVTSYEADLKRFPDRWHKIGLAFAVIFLTLLPFVATSWGLSLANLTLTAVVGSVGLMILTGFTGQVSLGHAAFLALGAYTAGTASYHLQLPVYIVLPMAGCIAAGVGLLVGPFALRLEGLYLAIVTLGLGFVVNHVLLSMPELTRGVSGIPVGVYLDFAGEPLKDTLPTFNNDTVIGPLTLNADQKLYLLFLPIAIAATLILSNIRQSNLGRAMMAVRDQDIAAAVLGVNPARVKILAFTVSSFITGIGGAMFAYQQQFINVDPPFNLLMSVQYIAMIVLGGIGTVFGAVAGPIAYYLLAPLAEAVGGYIPLIKTLSSAQQSTLLFSVLLIGFLLFEPLGLYGIWLRVKRYFLAWPFRY